MAESFFSRRRQYLTAEQNRKADDDTRIFPVNCGDPVLTLTTGAQRANSDQKSLFPKGPT
jgi:hypothetical protein